MQQSTDDHCRKSYIASCLLCSECSHYSRQKKAIKSRIQKSIRDEHYNIYNACTFYFMFIAVSFEYFIAMLQWDSKKQWWEN